MFVCGVVHSAYRAIWFNEAVLSLDQISIAYFLLTLHIAGVIVVDSIFKAVLGVGLADNRYVFRALRMEISRYQGYFKHWITVLIVIHQLCALNFFRFMHLSLVLRVSVLLLLCHQGHLVLRFIFNTLSQMVHYTLSHAAVQLKRSSAYVSVWCLNCML